MANFLPKSLGQVILRKGSDRGSTNICTHEKQTIHCVAINYITPCRNEGEVHTPLSISKLISISTKPSSICVDGNDVFSTVLRFLTIFCHTLPLIVVAVKIRYRVPGRGVRPPAITCGTRVSQDEECMPCGAINQRKQPKGRWGITNAWIRHLDPAGPPWMPRHALQFDPVPSTLSWPADTSLECGFPWGHINSSGSCEEQRIGDRDRNLWDLSLLRRKYLK